MRGYDAANTGYKPNATGPENGVSGVWTDPVEYGSLTGGEQPNGPGSTPAVVDGVVYVGSLGKHSLLAYDAETGEELWRFGVESVRDDPAVADGRVYFRDGGTLYALNAETGDRIWEFGGTNGGNPVVHDGKIYLGGAGLQVVEAEDREEVWSFDPKSNHSGSIAISEERVYAGHERIYSLDAETGEKDWGMEVEGTPKEKIVADGILYTVAVSQGYSERSLHAIDTGDGERLWEFGSVSHRGEPAVDEDKIYFGDSDFKLYALNKDTGEEVWSQEPCGSGVAVAGGAVYAGQPDWNTSLRSLDARTGEVRWSYKEPNGFKTRPVVVDGHIYIGGNTHNILAYEESEEDDS